MKILYLAKHNLPPGMVNQDYLCDMLFHGFRSVFGTDVVDWPRNNCMYSDVPDTERTKMYGKGFTVYCTLPEEPSVDRTDIESKIRIKYFDIIIYGQASRSLPFVHLVLNTYPKNRIIFFDGEDGPSLSPFPIPNNLTYDVPIFKRELQDFKKGVFPISFCIPHEKICTTVVWKSKPFAEASTQGKYTFDTEKDYYEEYQRSYFGKTQKKAGWDCLRHYEILANRCIPMFPPGEVQQIPPRTMTHFPKKILVESMEVLNPNSLNLELYWMYNNLLLEHLERYCTTEAMAKYVIDILKGIQ